MPRNPDITRAYDLVPEIGAGFRWYDYGYRLLEWLMSGWRRRILPQSVRTWLNDRLNDLLQFNEHDRQKVRDGDSVLEDFLVPPDEHVHVGGVWVVELFPPTELPALERAMSRSGWTKPRLVAPFEKDNLETLARSRSGSGASWWRLATVVESGSTRWHTFGAHRMRLPEEFEMIEIRAVQVGQALTGVVAHFTLSEPAEAALDATWHEAHEPVLARENGRLYPHNRGSAGMRKTQNARRALHSSARDWLAKHLPGSFASNCEPQLLVELLLLDQYNPLTADLDPSNEQGARFARANTHDVYRAIGLDLLDYDMITSESMPNLVLSEPRYNDWDRFYGDPTWTMWGNAAAAKAGFSEKGKGTGSSIEREVAHRIDNMPNVLPLLAIAEYLNGAGVKYARLRDRASTRHGRFKAGALRELRKSFLELSLNITTMQRDMNKFWRLRATRGGVSDFVVGPSPRNIARQTAAGRPIEKTRSFDKAIEKRLNGDFARLIEVDRDYRDILSTVASLGASADAFKIGRWALFVAIASLVVASATILLADVGCGSIVHQLIGWPSDASCMPIPSPTP